MPKLVIKDLVSVELDQERLKQLWEDYKKRNPVFAKWAEACVQAYLAGKEQEDGK